MNLRGTGFVALSTLGFTVLQTALAQAVCPVCAVAVVGGIELSRWLGVDDSITGLWVGGLVVSFILWTLGWLDKKNIHFKGRGLLTIAAYYLLAIAPLYFFSSFAQSLTPILFGLDKLMLGVIVGSVAFWAGAEWYPILKERNGGHAHFPFEKVVVPVAPLVVLSVLFYFLTM